MDKWTFLAFANFSGRFVSRAKIFGVLVIYGLSAVYSKFFSVKVMTRKTIREVLNNCTL